MNTIHSLHSAEASLVVEADPKRGVVWRHCGLRVDPGDLPRASQGRGPATFALDRDIGMPLVPPAGLGWFGPAAIKARDAAGAPVIFAADHWHVETTGTTLSVTQSDRVAGLEWRATCTVLSGGATRVSTSIINIGTASISLAGLASLQLPLAAGFAQVISWRGRHNAELNECIEPMPQQRWEKVSRRGLSGHAGAPGLYVLGQDTGWHSGMALAVQLQWSGDHTLVIERDDEGYWTLHAAATLAPGEVTLAPGERFDAPAALLAISGKGRNGALAQMHAAVSTAGKRAISITTRPGSKRWQGPRPTSASSGSCSTMAGSPDGATTPPVWATGCPIPRPTLTASPHSRERSQPWGWSSDCGSSRR